MSTSTDNDDNPDSTGDTREQPQQAAEDKPGFITGVRYPKPFDRYLLELVHSAARYVNIMSPALDHRVFDSQALADALSALARASRQTQVRLLVSDTRPIVSNGHRLLQLSRRLPSTVHIQVLKEHPEWNGETVVLRDRNGVLYKPGGSDEQGFFEPDSQASTQRHLDLFESLWRYSHADPDLRALSL